MVLFALHKLLLQQAMPRVTPRGRASGDQCDEAMIDFAKA
jgi:hypothetical protein